MFVRPGEEGCLETGLLVCAGCDRECVVEIYVHLLKLLAQKEWIAAENEYIHLYIYIYYLSIFLICLLIY